MINDFLTGPITVFTVLIIGIILTIKTKFVQITKFYEMLKHVKTTIFSKKTDGISGFSTATTALSGTIGTGNITGVAVAILGGGYGAIFWMWVSAFFSMATKYVEIVLAVKYREQIGENSYLGGPMYYMEKGLKNKKLAIFYSICCVITSFGIGNLVQINAVNGALHTIGINSNFIIPALLMVIVAFVLLGGIKRITKVTEMFLPIMAIFYIIGCLIVIITEYHNILNAFGLIIGSAFNTKSAGFGILGFLFTKSAKVGISRGIFTNEAGLGSAPIVHAASNEKIPHKQGLWGIFEVFFDTIIMCTLTALVIILSGVLGESINGNSLTILAFEKYLGSFSTYFLAISIMFFAISSIIAWSYYGQTAINYITKNKFYVKLFKISFIIMIYFGFVLSLDFVWGFSDVVNSLMLIPNTITILLLYKNDKKLIT